MEPRRPLRVDIHVHPTRYSPHGPGFAERNGLDYSPQGLLGEMDRHGIRYGLFLAPRLAPGVAEAREEALSVYRSSGGRLLPTATVDPSRGPQEVERVLGGWAASEEAPRAIKLYPGYQPYAITETRVEPVYAWAERRAIPVFVHLGDTSDPDGRLRHTRPLDLDEVAVRWPGVHFVLCHLGNPWIEEAAEVIRKNENVYGDTSGLLNPFAPRYAALVRRMTERLRHALYAVGEPAKLLYGSDWPISSLADALGLVHALGLPAEEEDAILGENARSLLRLPP